MSYAYLFKYIIIGDTGTCINALAHRALAPTVMAGVAGVEHVSRGTVTHTSSRIFTRTQASASHAYSFSSPISVFSTSTT
jgi:hypothetical protein